MANSIRTPKLGVTEGSRRIAQAVDNEDWQKFRVSMKGQSTRQKLRMLKNYYEAFSHAHYPDKFVDLEDCDVCIRLHNYITALCRGGQLKPGESLLTALAADFRLEAVR